MNKNTKQKILLKGMPANKGCVSGAVRIILDDDIDSNDKLLAKELSKVKDGDVLVTEMTRPLYVVCFRKAVAIVTDRGGILCHAAMASREFGLPCIVNTKNATKVLKNGQRVMVDANKGIIYEAQ